MHLHPRLRLRTLLIAVAVVGLALGGWQMWKRREYCLKRAASLARLAANGLNGAKETEEFWSPYCLHAERDRAGFLGGAVSSAPAMILPLDWRYAEMYEQHGGDYMRIAARFREQGLRLAEMAARYRHVARYPWLPMPSEMPPPE